MSNLLLLQYESRKARTLEETIEDWRLLHENDVQPADVERLIGELLSIPEAMETLRGSILERARRDEIADLEVAGAFLRDLLERILRILDQTKLLSERVAAASQVEIEHGATLQTVSQRIRALLERHMKTWPWRDRPLPEIDRKMTEEAYARLDRGEGEDVSDILARLQAGGPLLKE